MNSGSPLLPANNLMKAFVAPILIISLALIWLTQSITAQRPDISVPTGPKVFESGSERVALVELFTSQGCSSCPPADTYLSKTLRNDDLWKKYVPVAWHVDYWDRLGWLDPYGSAANTERQYAYQKSAKINSVYTPGFVLNGTEWRGYFERRALPDSSELSAQHPKNLKATVDGKSVSVDVAEPATGEWEVHIAVLGFGLETQVERGENSRRALINDFVALDHQQAKLTATQTASFTLPDLSAAGAKNHAIAVWITAAGELSPVQATGGWLD